MSSRHAVWPRDREKVKDAKIDKKTLKRVASYAKPYRKKIYIFLGIIVFQSILGITPALLFGRIIDDAIPEKNTRSLAIFAALIVIAAILEAVAGIYERLLSSKVGEGLIYDLRVALFRHVQQMPIAFFTRIQTGALTSRLNNDVIGAQRALTATLGTIVSNIIILVTTLIAMFYAEWRLTLLALVLTPFFILPYRWIGALQQKITREAMDLNASMNSTMTQRFDVAGALLVKLYGRGEDEVELFADRADKVRKIGVKTALYVRGFLTMLGLLAAIGTALVYGLGGWFVINGSFTIGQLATMGLLVGRIYNPLTSLTNARVDILTALVSFERVFEVLDMKNPIVDKKDAKVLSQAKGKIEYQSVSFNYLDTDSDIISGLVGDSSEEIVKTDNVEVLKNISFTANQGETVAIVGPSGAGKSTLVSLLPRLYDVTSGSIKIDGVDIRGFTQDSLRKSIGVVTQDPHLFHESIRDNLLYAKPDATDDELFNACRAAQIINLVEQLPNGLDTLVGERGYRMSGGEVQRLSIARVFLKNPAIIILDEATSHLDSENEALVQEALTEILTNRTALIIAHRLSTVVNSDRIIVLNDGEIEGEGTHQQLLKDQGLYNDLYKRFSMQA